MNSLTPRQQYILSELIKKKVSNVDVLHKELAVSIRTILREVASINKVLKKDKITIYDYENMNLVISGDRDSIKNLENSINSIPILWLCNKDQRQIAITCKLLSEEEYLKASYFSYKFNVVMGSISQDLDNIQTLLVSKNLHLIRKRTYGIMIDGSEWNKRNAFVELFFRFKPFEYLLSFLYGHKTDETVEAFFKDIFDAKTIDIVKEIFKKLHFGSTNVNDIKYFSLFLLTLLAIKKTESKKNINLPNKVKQDMKSSIIYNTLRSLQEKLMENNIILPEDELSYLCLHLNDYKYYNDADENNVEADINYTEISNELVTGVSKKIGINITKDKKLVEDLSNHLKQTFHMLSVGLDIINPLLNEIKEHYSQLFAIINNECKLIFSRYNIKILEEEIGYITMHIDVAIQRQQIFSKKINLLIVCPNGMSSGNILGNKVKSLFSDIESITISSIHDAYEKMVNNEYDLILSTVPISLQISNVIVVSPFMTNEDIEEVRNFIFKIKMEKQNIAIDFSDRLKIDATNMEYETISSILKDFDVREVKVNTFDELIDYIVTDIYDSNLSKSKETIKKLILKREEKGNVVVPKSGIALLHTRSNELMNPVIRVYRNNKYFSMSSEGFSTEDINTFLVLLARNDESNYVLQFLGKVSISLMERKGFVQMLRYSNSQDIRNCLIDIANKEEVIYE
ncbi:transcription antiterminator BglG [Clostridium acetobutylicum]|nr:transcription antiterminator BglG [Clostridium acetobutylicum]